MSKPKTVLLAFGWHDHRLLRGIAMYAAEHSWHISAASITHEFNIPSGWKGDGVLTWSAGADELIDFVLSLKRPTVDFSLRRPNLPFGHVALDHEKASELVADHLLQHGFHNFLFYSDSDNWTFEERGRGFLNTLKTHGHECKWIKFHESKTFHKERYDWQQRHKWLATQLEKEPKPLAVYTANGTLAVEVREVCVAAGLSVPEDVAIVGIEDDLLLPQASQLAITAVDPNLEELGYQGAAVLDRMMNGEPQPKETMRIPPARLITRQSTDITAVTHEGLIKALRFITENFGNDIDVDSVARVAGMSRRGMHQAFMKHLGTTPGEHLRSTRIEHAKKMLAETDNKVESVAKFCGYQSVNTFFIAFKQSCGTSPAEYRQIARRGR